MILDPVVIANAAAVVICAAIADDLRLRCGQDTIDVECRTIGCTLSGGVARQALDRALFTGAHHAVGRAVSLHPGQAQ